MDELILIQGSYNNDQNVLKFYLLFFGSPLKNEKNEKYLS